MSAARGPLLLALERVRFEAGGRRIIDDVSLSLAGGRRTVVLGPNGAGKSLLLRLCHGLLVPTAGTIRWDVREAGTRDKPAALRAAVPRHAAGPRQAMVFQKPVMLRRSAVDNVRYALALAGVGGTAAADRSIQALARVGLAALARQPARTLSGGEQQRLAIARAWALEPDVLFLDEPTASLDPAAAQEIERLIGAIAATGTWIIMTTHHLPLAARMADEIVFMLRGRAVEHSPAAQFFVRPRTPEADAFMASERIDATRPSPPRP